jgi:hypothetical protein
MKMAIMGNRRRKDRENVTSLVNSFASDTVVVSGDVEE